MSLGEKIAVAVWLVVTTGWTAWFIYLCFQEDTDPMFNKILCFLGLHKYGGRHPFQKVSPCVRRGCMHMKDL